MRFWPSGCGMGCRAIVCLSTLGVGKIACGEVVRKLLLLRAVGMLALWLYLLVAKTEVQTRNAELAYGVVSLPLLRPIG